MVLGLRLGLGRPPLGGRDPALQLAELLVLARQIGRRPVEELVDLVVVVPALLGVVELDGAEKFRSQIHGDGW